MPQTPSVPVLFPQRSDTPAQAVAAQFSQRPTVRQVAAQLLRQSILEHYPTLAIDPDVTRLAIPNQLGGWDLKRLLDVALDYLGSGTLPDFGASINGRRCFLTNQPPQPLTYEANGPRDPELSIIEGKIRQLADTLSTGFQDALSDYWNRPGVTGAPRWQWLGDLLTGNLSSAASLLPQACQAQQAALHHLTLHPDRRERQTLIQPGGLVHAYCLETCIVRGNTTISVMEPDLLIMQGPLVMLCRVSGALEFHASLEAFNQAWAHAMEYQVQADKIIIKRYEPDGNIFDTQAALLLERQLNSLDALTLPTRDGVAALEQLCAGITDPAPFLVDAPAPSALHLEKIQSTLPPWLRDAEAGDRFAYRQHLLESSRVQRQTAGASFLENVENLHDFTTRTLREQINADHPQSEAWEPDDLELTFHVPAGDLGSGFVTRVPMTLTELAINNLAAAPHGQLTLASKTGRALPDWLTSEYVLGHKALFNSTPGLIARVDIGSAYPQYVKARLLGDDSESRRREALFDQQLKTRLPLQTLEHKIRGEQGFTFQGYRYVRAVMHTSAPDRVVDNQDIVIRPLAFLSKAGATPDTVSNMFIIEPRDTRVGPHILYRPLYPDALQQFANRQALFDAIAQPGALQDSVLSWLPDRARATYSHNGFISPHVLRFGQGDDAVQWPAPEPACLATGTHDTGPAGDLTQSLAQGKLTQYLYGSNARALVDLADRDTVSNTESRWAILLEGSWLLFNALLMPLLRGPAMVVGWMLQLAVSLRQDLPGLHSDDASTRELAWVDLLLNIGLILLHVASPSSRITHRQADLPARLAPWRRPVNDPPPGTPVLIEQGSVGLPSEPPAGDLTQVDFIHSTAREGSGRRLLNTLLELHVPWPAQEPDPVEIGPFKGLYRIGQRWHASVAGLLFRVTLDHDANEVHIIHPQKPQHPGFKLKHDGRGNWALDLGLKLRGGGPKNRLNAKLAQIEQKRTQASEHINRISDEVSEQIRLIIPIDRALDGAHQQFERTHNQLGTAQARLRAAPEDKALIEAHAAKVLQRSRARLAFQVALERFEEAAARIVQLRRELMHGYQALKDVDSRFDYEAKCADQYLSILSTDEIRVSHLASLYLASFISEQGESVIELQNTARSQESVRYVYDLLETNFAASERHAEAMIAIETTLEDMARTLKTGPANRLKYLNGEPRRRFYNRLNAALESLDILTDLSIDLTLEEKTPQDLYFLGLLEDRHSAMSPLENSHLDLITTDGFTSSERKQVLTNLIAHYNRRLQIYRSLRDQGSALPRPQYMSMLIERLEQVRNSAETDLADLLREDEFLPSQAPTYKPVRAPSTTKRVFKSRDNGTLVGDLEPAGSDLPFATMVVRNPITMQVSGRFMEHPHEGWVQIIEAPPSEPVVPPVARSLATLRTQVQRLLDQVGPIERSIEFQKKKLNDPLRRDELNPRDWHDMLAQQAQRIESTADEIENLHGEKPETAQPLAQWRQRVSDIRQKARQYCIEGYKAQRPRQENIEYLRSQDAVDIGLVHGPQRTAAKDYVSEFAVREKNALTVLWYAHFHYTGPNSLATEYTVAHLKRPEQRFLTLKDLITQAGSDSRSIVRDLYNPITAPLDQRLFLSLLPA